MRCGRHGAYLRIDVSSGVSETVPIPDDVAERFVGGSGLGTWICLAEGGANTDALAAEAPIVFCFSPLVGTPLTTSAKFAVVARSPLTGYLCDAISSSHFAIAGKRTGYDALVLVGRSDRLVRVTVENGRVEIVAADELRGRAAADCGREGFRTAAIGPAGEHQVRFATISNDGRHAGRGGLGAILGAKNVKALSVRGSHATPLYDEPGVMAAARELSERSLGPGTAKYRELGTVANVLLFNRLQTLPSRNFQASSLSGAEALSGEALHAEAYAGRVSCAACTIGCEHLFRSGNGGRVRLEYETLFALGPLLGITDREAVLAAAALCDRLGIDTISAGGTLAFAMEAGLRNLRFGSSTGVLASLEAIGTGADPLLADGSRRAAAAVSRPELAMHVKGLELPGYDPRTMQAMALGLAVSTRGADHNRTSAYELDLSPHGNRLDFDPTLASRVVAIEDRTAAMDSLILCKFLRSVFEDFAGEAGELLERVTGSRLDLRAVGERVCTLRKMFNLAAGWSRADDTLPERLLEGVLDADKLDRMIAAYYRARGWTEAGNVPKATAARLDLLDLPVPALAPP